MLESRKNGNKTSRPTFLYSIILSFQLLSSISELFPAVSRNFRIEPESKIIVTQEGSHCLI